jgi:hypothetical protein
MEPTVPPLRQLLLGAAIIAALAHGIQLLFISAARDVAAKKAADDYRYGRNWEIPRWKEERESLRHRPSWMRTTPAGPPYRSR